MATLRSMDASRRELLRSVAGAALLALWPRSARAGGGSAERVLRQARALSASLRGGAIVPVAWQDEMTRLFADVDFAELARRLDLEKLLAGRRSPERGALVVPLGGPRLPAPALPGFAIKIFAFRPGRANPPHAHDHMVSMHLVLRGRFHVRHFERLGDEPGHLRIRPTIDRRLGPGEETSISDERDNVHWHVAEGDALLLDVLCAGLRGRRTRTHLVDVARGEALGDETIRVPRFASVEQALRRYG